MNKNTAIINLPAKKKMAIPDKGIIAHLNKHHKQPGSTYLYKVLHKNFTNADTAAIRYITLPLDKSVNRFIKRTADIFLSLLVITTILWWLIPVMAVLIKAGSRGPVFFMQKRTRQNGAVFTCIKFRSMIINAAADILPAGENDKRITTIGRVIRKTFIDELPQFFNVLWGDMSVIGPRPHMISESLRFEEEVQYYTYRERVRPGITGLAQIMGLEGAANTAQKMKDRIDVDIFYLQHWSLKLDIIILYRTACKMVGL